MNIIGILAQKVIINASIIPIKRIGANYGKTNNCKHMKKNIIFYFLIPTLFFMNGCISPPENLIAPSFDATYAFPITDTLYTLNEFIKDDSSIVALDDPSKLGVLIYIKNEIIDPFYVNENLKIDPFSSLSSLSIDTIKINEVPPVIANIALKDWAPELEGPDLVFPEVSTPITSPFELINEFESALFESGKLELTIHNNLPVETQFQKLKIVNTINNSIVVETPLNSTITILPFDSTKVTFDLINVAITSKLELQAPLYTPGSTPDTVRISQNANIGITMVLYDFVIESVTGKLPKQDPFTINDSFTIDDSTKIETMKFDEGNFNIVLNNYFDLDMNIDFEVSNLFDDKGNVYSNSFNLSRKERNKIIEIPSLKDWEIRTTTPGIPTNQLIYSATILSDVADDIRTLAKDDSVTLSLQFSESSIAYAEGLIKQTKFNITESNFNFDLGDLNNLTFKSIEINNPSMILNLTSSINYDIILDGLITGTSSNLKKELEIKLNLPALANSKFDLNEFGFTEFVNSFTNSGELPEKFILSGSGIVNPNYNIGSISKTDSVAGSFSFEAPFNFGISGGSFQDTFYINDIDINDEFVESINFVELTIETLNEIPVNIVFTGSVLDTNDNPLFPFPPSYSPDTHLIIEAPTVDKNGDVVSAKTNKQIIHLAGEDAKTFINNPNIAINFSLDTPPQNNVTPVKFRNTDSIYFKIYGKVDYKMNNN